MRFPLRWLLAALLLSLATAASATTVAPLRVMTFNVRTPSPDGVNVRPRPVVRVGLST